MVTIQLDGTGSFSGDDNPLTYEWTTDCPGAVFNDNTIASPELTIDTSAGCPVDCTVTLTVDEIISDPVSCTSSVSLLGGPLQCNAGGPYEEECQGTTTEIALDGSQSMTTEEGAQLTYEWSSDCPGAAFDDNTSATPILTVDSSQECTTECTATLIVDDGINEPQSCLTDVVVDDRAGPVLEGLPEMEEIALSCDEEIPAPPEVTASDDCDGGDIIVSFEQSEEGDDCARTITRSWSATDACGNTTTASQTILIEDASAPLIELDQELELSVECDAIPEAAEATVTDNCEEGVEAVFEETDDGATCPTTLTRTWTATDACGNSSSVTQTITVDDTTGPVIEIDQETELVLQCDDEIPDPAQATVSDNCDSDLEVTFEETDDGQTCPRTIARTWTAIDSCGNPSSLTQTIVVDDTIAPTIELNGDAVVTLECSLDEYVEMGAAVTDNCDAPSEATVGGDSVDVSTPGTYVVTYDAEDACGNAADQVTRIVEVVDTTPPEIIMGAMLQIWPANHRYVTLDLSDLDITIEDECAGQLPIGDVATILSIYSDESENAQGNGDGNTDDDILIGGSTGFQVRAERAGGGNGRVYGITFMVSDPAGNTAEATASIGVPHDQSGNAPIDDGPEAGYTVQSTSE